MAILLALSGCLMAPLVQGAKEPASELGILRGQVNTRLAGAAGAVTLRPGGDSSSALRGLYLNAGEGRPLVLHLLPSGATLKSAGPSVANIFRQFEQLGFSSLCLDYPGIGYSDGDPRYLAGWAVGIAQGAAQLAGSSELLLMRGTSLGAMVGAKGLEVIGPTMGATWIAPVQPNDVVDRFARIALGWPLGPLSAGLFATPDLGDPIAAARETPTFVVAAPCDPLLRERERMTLIGTAEDWAQRLDAGAPPGSGRFDGPLRRHVSTGTYFGRLAPGEVSHLARLAARRGLDLNAELKAALAARTGATEDAIESFWSGLDDRAAEVALLLLTRGRAPIRGPGLLQPLRPDGSPVPASVWIPFLRSIRMEVPAFEGLEALLERQLYLQLGEPFDFYLAFRAHWPFNETHTFGRRWNFGKPADQLAVLAYTAGAPHFWATDPDGTAVLMVGLTASHLPADPRVTDPDLLHPDLCWTAFSSNPQDPRPSIELQGSFRTAGD